jgi:thiamine-monophosphate kinase
MVSGPIGDGTLGLAAVQGEIADAGGALARRYRLPEPRLDLREALLERASAAADVSDGLVADAGHIAEASGLRVVIELERLPLSAPAQAWLAGQPDRAAALVRLATGGDDYEVVCAAPAPIAGFTVVGHLEEGAGAEARLEGLAVETGAGGWRHG